MSNLFQRKSNEFLTIDSNRLQSYSFTSNTSTTDTVLAILLFCGKMNVERTKKMKTIFEEIFSKIQHFRMQLR